MIKLSKVNRFIGFQIGGFGTLCFLIITTKKPLDERNKTLVYLIFFCLLLLYIIIEFLIMLKEKEYQSDIWNIEYMKDNLSKEQWKEYKNKWLCHNKQLINSHFYRGVSELPSV